MILVSSKFEEIYEMIDSLEGVSPEDKRILTKLISDEFEEQQALACKDILGDWFNRRGLFYQAEVVFSGLERKVFDCVSVAFIDLDNFKSINDTHGHICGDKCIAIAANVIRKSIRTIDTYGCLGGDEFVIVFPNASVEVVEMILSRIAESFIDADFGFEIGDIELSLTFGIASTDESDDGFISFESLLDLADKRMNANKFGRSR